MSVLDNIYNYSFLPYFSRSPSIVCLGLSAGKFQDDSGSGSSSIQAMFAKGPVAKVKATETASSSDNDSDIELMHKEVKKGTIKSFFKQRQDDLNQTEVSDSEPLNNDEVNAETLVKNKGRTSIASFFKSKETETLSDIDKSVADKIEAVVNDDSIEEVMSDGSKTSHTNNRHDRNKIDFFLHSKGKKACEINTHLDNGNKLSNQSYLYVELDSSVSDSKSEFDIHNFKDTEKIRSSEKLVNALGVNCQDDQADILESEVTDTNVNALKCTEVKLNTSDSEEGSNIGTSEQQADVNETRGENNILDESETSQTFSPEDYLPCEKCRKPIAVWDMPEHMDFHFAMDLQKDINTLTSPSVTSHTGKRKSVGSDSRNSKKIKTSSSQGKLDSFFSRKT